MLSQMNEVMKNIKFLHNEDNTDTKGISILHHCFSQNRDQLKFLLI